MWTLDDVVAALNDRRQRATYGAVAKVVGRPVRGLMRGRTDPISDSWVVAATTSRQSGSRRGRPTGFTDADMHPDCLRQFRESPNDVIDDADELRAWLEAG